MPREREIRMLDLIDPEEEVEVLIVSQPGGDLKLWVNVDGICRLRISAIDSNILRVDLTKIDSEAVQILSGDKPDDQT